MSDVKPLMNEMAEMFPKLPAEYQEQARQAHSHVQSLIRDGLSDQAVSLLRHMRDLMKDLIKKEEIQTPFSQPLEVEEHVVSIPPLPPSSSPEILALQRSVEEMQMRMKENSAISLIAKRVRDMDMEQKYFQLEERLRVLRETVASRLNTIDEISQTASTLARREAKKRTVSKNPFCDHETSGFCDFCVGRDFEEDKVAPLAYARRPPPAESPPSLPASVRENLVTKEMVIQMQRTLDGYKQTMNDLLQQKRLELSQIKK